MNIRNAVTEDVKKVSDDNQVRGHFMTTKITNKSLFFFSSKELSQKLEKLDIGESQIT